ncbi:hypothetical protein KP509_1Z091500 [Ceratopteris richardii]|nr:hypothetical protein KP509_1Z226700 [Ceratopteris richardii]KAH6557823.1 hypothetical protein KP509_1Z091500 [Ceratopteris richardii]
MKKEEANDKDWWHVWWRAIHRKETCTFLEGADNREGGREGKRTTRSFGTEEDWGGQYVCSEGGRDHFSEEFSDEELLRGQLIQKGVIMSMGRREISQQL